jgi:hypothetical protein
MALNKRLDQNDQFNQQQGLREKQFGLLQRQQDRADEKQASETQDRALSQVAGITQYINGLPADDPQRKELWGHLAGHEAINKTLQSHGVDPNDHVNGPLFMAKQFEGWQDPQKTRLNNATIEEKGSHAAYYDKAGDALTQRSAAAQTNAQTARLNAYGDLAEKLGTTPTREQWEAPENQGLINAAFGGPMPYEKSRPLLVQAQMDFQRQFEPTAEEREMGITREHKMEARRQEKLRDMYGVEQKALIGKSVRLKPDGSFEAIPGANTVGERNQAVIAKQGLERLDEGEKMLASKGTVKQFFGDLSGSKFASGYGEAGQGFRNVKAAILDLNFALSGKSVSNKEREEFLNLYMPHWSDSTATQQQKMRMVRGYFNQVLKMRNEGASDDEIKRMHDKMLSRDPELEVNKGSSSPETMLDDARAAIKNGAPRDKVIERLKQNRIDPGRL